MKARGKLSDALAGVVAHDRGAVRRSVGRAGDGRGGGAARARSRARSSRRASPRATPKPRRCRRRRRRLAGVAQRARRRRGDAASRAAERDWTAEELDVFARHVVNLRKGKLSSERQLQLVARAGRPNLHRAASPRTRVARRRTGSPPRVLFFAHGGLVEEREGLLPVLARRRFWEMNGVYPVLLRVGDGAEGNAARHSRRRRSRRRVRRAVR